MYKACSRCGKIHDSKYRCNVGRVYSGSDERRMRSTSAWKNKSREIRDDANNLCEVCFDQGVINYKRLEVHHIIKLRENADGLLDDLNLICLCEKHHKEADEGLISADYLRSLAKARANDPPLPCL